MKDTSIMITGATGNNGTELLKRLASGGIQARAMVRPGADARAISALPGIEVAEGDFDTPSSLERVHYQWGEAASVEQGMKDAIGQPPHTFAEFARDYASALRG